MQCIITEKQTHKICLINMKHYDETKKRAHDSQIARAKENIKLSHGGPSQKTSIIMSYLSLSLDYPRFFFSVVFSCFLHVIFYCYADGMLD